MYLVVSDHAWDRLEQRVQGEVEIPEARILKLGKLVETNDEFHVRGILYTFVCKRGGDAVILVTVLYNVTDKPKTTKQNRQKEFHTRRLGRLQTEFKKERQWERE